MAVKSAQNLIAEAEKEVQKEINEKKKEDLKVVLREINQAEEVVRRLKQKKDRLIADLGV